MDFNSECSGSVIVRSGATWQSRKLRIKNEELRIKEKSEKGKGEEL